MATAASSQVDVDLGHEVVGLIDKVKSHVPHLVDSQSKITVVTDDGIRETVHLDIGGGFRITTFGLVRTGKSAWRPVVIIRHTLVCELSSANLMMLKDQLTQFQETCQRVFGHVV